MKVSFKLYPWATDGRHSWDPATALYAVEGCGEFFIERHGKVTVEENGTTVQYEKAVDEDCVLFQNIADTTVQEAKDKTAEYLDSIVMELHEKYSAVQ